MDENNPICKLVRELISSDKSTPVLIEIFKTAVCDLEAQIEALEWDEATANAT